MVGAFLLSDSTVKPYIMAQTISPSITLEEFLAMPTSHERSMPITYRGGENLLTDQALPEFNLTAHALFKKAGLT